MSLRTVSWTRLRCVAVADFEERTLDEHRDVERAAGDELAVVEIAGVAARRVAADASELWRRRYAHAAEERLQRDDDAGLELRCHRPAIERQQPRGQRAVAVRGDEAAAAVVAVVDGQVD